MRRATLYSSSSATPKPEKPVAPRVKRTWRDLYTSYERNLLLGTIVLLAMLALASHFGVAPVAALTQQQIDAAVARSLSEQPLPSPAVKAYEAVRGAIVHVRAVDPDENRAAGS